MFSCAIASPESVHLKLSIINSLIQIRKKNIIVKILMFFFKIKYFIKNIPRYYKKLTKKKQDSLVAFI